MVQSTVVVPAVSPPRVTMTSSQIPPLSPSTTDASPTVSVVAAATSLSAMVPLSLAGTPTSYPAPGSTVSMTSSGPSTQASSTGASVRVTAAEPSANVTVPAPSQVPPAAVTM